MNNLRDTIDRLTSGSVPAWAMVVLGVVLLLVVVRVAKGLFKFALLILGLALVAAGVWWHLHKQGSI